ncbi:elongation factor 2-like [Aegilops tauschii subsp. strangulata]|uniref:Elongation factor 2 n=1 Tax=Aegilops tauschii TaxID=37682 RepID=N1QQA0_AEGTA
MVFPAAELCEAMDKKDNIRNVSIVGHLSHDSLIAAAGIIGQEGAVDARMTDTRADEAERGISIKSTGISLLYEMQDESLKAYKGERDGNRFLINLIDSPGHVDFSAEVTAALRITDGAMVIVDCIEGVCVQTETVLRLALGEMVRPVLCLNKMDQLFPGLQGEGVKRELNGEQVYQILNNVIQNASDIVSACGNGTPHLGDVQFYPDKGNVAFSAGIHDWAFTLPTFAKICAPILGTEESQMVTKLWGDNFYNHVTKKWTNVKTGSKACQRGFVTFCYNTIEKVIQACMDNQKDELWRMLHKFGVSINDDDKNLSGVALVKRVMQTWLPASSALLEMMIFHLPSPLKAQEYRVENLYEGPLDDIYAEAIRKCDPEGPLMMYVSKMIPAPDVGRFFAFGRVFSGKVETGMKVRIMGPSYVSGMKRDLYVKRVERTVIWMGRDQDGVGYASCGNLVGMVGLDECIAKGATLTSQEEVDACPIRAMKFSVSPVMYVTVECKPLSEIPKFTQGMKRLAKSDLVVFCSQVGQRTYTVAGAGELHLEICLNDLRGYDASWMVLKLKFLVLCKSRNGHNSLTMVACPLDEKLVQAIDDGLLGHVLIIRGPNIVLDMCKGRSDLNLLKETLVECFQMASVEGALIAERMRGICFEIHDVVLHTSEKFSHTKNQLIPMIKEAINDCQLKANPRLLEPVYMVEIQAPESALEIIYGILNQKMSHVFQHFQREGTQLFILRSYLNVGESFGFAEDFRAATSGEVTPQCVLDHWDTLSSDPLMRNSLSWGMVLDIRKAKKLSPLQS